MLIVAYLADSAIAGLKDSDGKACGFFDLQSDGATFSLNHLNKL